MKAEQRKELETNTLADKMGHLMQRVKGGERRTFLIYFLIVAGIFVVGFLTYRWYYRDVQITSEHWIMLYDGSRDSIAKLADDPQASNTAAGKAAQFQYAWLLYWDLGVRMSAADPRGGMRAISDALQIYRRLEESCKDDPVFEPQAMLGLAVCMESLAAQDRNNLKKAKTQYQQLVDSKYSDTAEGKFAKQRLDILSNEKTSKELASSYDNLQRLLAVPPPLQLPPGLKLGDLPVGHP